jgi:Pentapeptide repeats (8 copies)
MVKGKDSHIAEQGSQERAQQKKVWTLREYGGKPLWDWMDLLIVPVAVALVTVVVTVVFTWQQEHRQNRIEAQRARTERQIEEQRAQDAALQAYLDQMSSLLLDKDRSLRQSKAGSEVRTLARARTLTVLTRLESQLGNSQPGTPSHLRKGSVLQFLYESRLIEQESNEGQPIPAIISLTGADLSGVQMTGRIDLSGADLSDADLSDANLSDANLQHADLSKSNLSGANLSDADLSGANLSIAELSKSNLSRADLSEAFLSEADLSDADLSGAVLSDAKASTDEQLDEQLLQARSLEGAIMPDRTIYPGRFATRMFEPAFSFEVGRGWVIPSSETSQELPIDRSTGPGAHPNQLRFIRTDLVFDPRNPSKRKTVSAPDNADAWASWFRSHPKLETSKPVQVPVGNASGVQIDVISSSKPGKYPKDCEQPCVSLFPSCTFPTCNYGFPYPLPSNSPSNEREIVSYADSKGYPRWKDRFVIVDVEGETVVVDVKATADKFDEFLPEAQKVLDSVEWTGG